MYLQQRCFTLRLKLFLIFSAANKSSEPKASTSSDTFGGGSSDFTLPDGPGLNLLNNSSFVEQVAEIVSKKLNPPKIHQPTAVNPFWKNYERAQPTVVFEQIDNPVPPAKFSSPVFQTDLNDSFDEEALLKKVPKPCRKNASLILKRFDERPNELTWDAGGHIYVDEQVIPQANIHELFPLLFRKKCSKKVPAGFSDFLDKIYAMGLSSLIRMNNKPQTKALKSVDTKTAEKVSNWWYLGE